MRIEREASNTCTLAARPTLTPSKWLMYFTKVDGGNVQACIAGAITTVGSPVQLTFTEVSTGANALAGEATLPPGQWRLSVHEQSSTTNLDPLLSDRSVFAALVEVVGPVVAPAPSLSTCAIIEAWEWAEIKACMSSEAIDEAIIDLCSGGGPCDPIDIQLNGVSVAAPECGDTINIPSLNSLGTPVGSWDGTRWLAPSGQAQLRDTDNNPISTAAVPSNTAVALTAPDATAVVRNSVPTTISTTPILSGQSVNIALDDITHTDSDGSPVTLPAQVPFVATPCGGGCLFDLVVNINGVEVANVTDLDPCEDNTVNLTMV